jgi:protease I
MQKILLFVENGYEDLELQYPRYRMIEEGMEVVLAGEKANELYKGKNGYPCKSHISFDEVDVSAFSALIIPGGSAPEKLRVIPKVLEITREFHKQKKLIAFICHGGSVPVSAGIMKGVTCTSYVNIKEEIMQAGAHWVDKPVVCDGHFISSRIPVDLPYFCPAIIAHLKKE